MDAEGERGRERKDSVKCFTITHVKHDALCVGIRCHVLAGSPLECPVGEVGKS
jgi:hypothetical protein